MLSTKAFTSKLTIFYLLAFALVGKYDEGRKQLLKTADAVEQMLADESFIAKIQNIAEKLSTVNDMYILGRGLSYPIALEASHKIKEASYIHSESFAGGEPKRL